MDKDTLSQYGWVLISIIVIVILITLATPFGNFVSESIMSSTKAFKNITDNYFNSLEIKEPINTQPELSERLSNCLIREIPQKLQNQISFDTNLITDKYLYATAFNGDASDSLSDYIPSNPDVTYQTDAAEITTGIVVTAYDKDSNKIGDYYLVIIGDVAVDGLIDFSDSGAIEAYLCGLDNITTSPEIESGAAYLAADINNDGVIDYTDSEIIENCGAYAVSYPDIISSYWNH